MDQAPPEIRVKPHFDYQADLGQFVMVFGLAEAVVKRLLNKTVGVDYETALAIFSGVRANEATNLIRRCYEARSQKIPAQMDALLSQFIVLNSLRNNVLHHGIDFQSDPPVSSNRNSVLNVSAVRETVIEPGTLKGASTDCGRIILGVSTYLVPMDDPEAEERARDNLTYSADSPWNYKPRAPANPDQPRRQRKERRGSGTRQPPPSPEK